jgi:hypothetical protein
MDGLVFIGMIWFEETSFIGSMARSFFGVKRNRSIAADQNQNGHHTSTPQCRPPLRNHRGHEAIPSL